MKSDWNPEMLKAFEMIMKIDHTFKKVYDQIGLPKNRTMKKGFQSLAKIIIGQQISTNVANNIHNKLMIDDALNENKILSLSVIDLKKYGLSSQKSFYLKNLAELIHKKEINLNTLNKLSSEEISVAKNIHNKLMKDDVLNKNKILSLSVIDLKKYGLSSQKSFYLKNLAELIHKKEINLNTLNKLSSEEISDTLIKIKGVGKWTINNYKIFVLQEINAWPSADLALQEAVKIIKKVQLRPNESEMEKLGNQWEPYRTAAALFLWHFYNKVKVEKINIQI